MKKGLVFLLAASTLFGLGFMGQTEKVEAAGTWNLVEDVNSLKAGDQIIIAAKDYNYALSTTQNGNNRGQAPITKLEETVSFGEDVQILTLNAGTKTGTFGLYTGSGYLYAASSSSNYLRTESTLSDNSSWSFSIADGTATVKATGSNTRNVLQYNQSSSLFSCYSSASQKSIVIYELDVEEPVEKTPTQEVKELLTSYYNNGSYQRDTVINLKNDEETKKDLISCFHANVDILDRTTYFVGNQLWMSHGAAGDGKYSYYGTRGGDMTSGRSSEAFVQPKSIHIAQKGVDMEGKYTTMNDIKDNSAEWKKTGEVYSTEDEKVIQMFLDFTAPCFLGLSGDKANYFSLDHVEVEQKGETLELRLVTTGDKGKLTDANGVLSVATITKGSYNDQVVITNIADVPSAANGTKVDVTGKVVRMYNSANSFYIADEKGNELLVFKTKLESVGINDVVNIVGKKEYVNEAPRIAENSTGTMVENNEYTPEEISKTLAEVYEIANGLDKNVVSNEKYQVTGTVAIKDGKYYLTDGIKEMQLYNGDNDDLHDGYTVTVLGNVTKYNNSTLEFVNYSLSNIIPCNYSVTINNITNGSVQASVSENLPYGTEVTLTIEADTGYVIDSLIVNGESVTVSNNKYTFNIEKDTTVSATFKNNAVQTADETLAVAGKTGKLNGTSISWTKGNVTFTNNKTASSNAIRTSDTDHYRVYANSEVVISASNSSTISKVVITCTSPSYATVMKNGATSGGYTATSSGSTVTITANNVSEIKFTVSEQTRLNKIVVTHTVA